MSNDESAHCCVLGEGGSLLSSAVTGLGGARFIRLTEGGFVIEHIHATEESAFASFTSIRLISSGSNQTSGVSREG